MGMVQARKRIERELVGSVAMTRRPRSGKRRLYLRISIARFSGAIKEAADVSQVLGDALRDAAGIWAELGTMVAVNRGIMIATNGLDG